jgi:low affinity Fe/Cu permease
MQNKKVKVNSPYQFIENLFEKFSTVTLKIFSNSITFIFAVLLVIFWFVESDHSGEGLQGLIRDIILAITFLSFFIIQKTQNRLSAATHLKLNELVKAQENASNTLLNVEKKSGAELAELEKKFEDDSNSSAQQ